ncbi:hypothetical protein Val02_50990 [Virgisporangium aliadipatigenens]|uniref:SPOR domain-containing protein n=2 Tax=Virgisporangium aliadipatigenens TaxID=741659 RepID=A0A8J3YQ02_9ACTN|nr:hypothetical protein Val02_50990 [Virgisporangium aliadipatigenens]
MQRTRGGYPAEDRANTDKLPHMSAWIVWRQDDNGNRFEVRRFDDRAAAEALAAEMEARGHKQIYWVAPAES